MKKCIITIFSICLVSVIVFRIYYLNVNAVQPQENYYNLNEEVSIGENYFESEIENMNGYSIICHEVKVKTYKQFISEYTNSKDYVYDSPLPKPLYVYDVLITIKNNDNSEGYIDLFNYKLQTSNTYYQINENFWELTVPQLEGSLNFKLRKDTSMEFHLPFTNNPYFEKKNDNKDFQKSPFYLVISQYPIKKMIEVN